MFQASRGSQSASLAKTNPLLLKDDPVGEVLYVTPSSGGENERVAVRLEVNGFNVAHDAIDVKMATVVAGTTSVSPTTVSLEVEPAGDSFIVIVQRTVTGLPSQRSHFTFTKDKQPGKWKVMTRS